MWCWVYHTAIFFENVGNKELFLFLPPACLSKSLRKYYGIFNAQKVDILEGYFQGDDIHKIFFSPYIASKYILNCLTLVFSWVDDLYISYLDQFVTSSVLLMPDEIKVNIEYKR